MARLILDENGKRRAFKLNNGRLTVGSGEGNALRLQSEDVAEFHAELEIADGVVTLVPKAGVMPPVLLGRPVKQPTRLAANAEFHIGGALLRIESDAAAAPAATSAAPVRSGAARATRSAGAAPAGGAGGAGRPRGVTHKRRTISKGVPTWAILLVIAALAGAGYFMASDKLGAAEDIAWDPAERYREAVLAYEGGASKRASDELDNVDLTRADAELKSAVAALRKKVDASLSAGVIAEHNIKGTGWLDSNMKKYVETYLSGDRATRARARLFVKRCKDFRREYPQHPELGWVDRYQKRFDKLADMNSPSEYEDVAWEVKRLTAAKPRDYALVFELIDDFAGSNGGLSGTQAGELRTTQLTERDAYFLDRMQQSRYHWEKEEYGSAVEWLVQVIIQIGDRDMETQAIDFFLKMQTKDGSPLSHRYLASYKKDRPEVFETLVSFPRLRSAAEAAGVL